MSDEHRPASPWALAFDDKDLDPAQKERFRAALPILGDAIERMPIDVPGITVEEVADVLEATAKMLRQCEGWPERLTMSGDARSV